jgi:hypothetical protein
MDASRVAVVGSVPLTLDQVVDVVRQLDPSAREQVARALLETDFDARLAALVRRLSQRQPENDLTASDFVAEVRSARRPGSRARNAPRRH